MKMELMSKPSTLARPEARCEIRLRQLCGLGVGGLVLAPTLLGQLRQLAPDISAIVFHRRPGERAHSYQDSPDAAALITRPDVQRALQADGACNSPELIRMQLPDGSDQIGLLGIGSNLSRLQRLEPLIRQVLTPREIPGVAEVENGGSALFVADAQGLLRWASSGARRLLAMALGAADPRLPPAALRQLRLLVSGAPGEAPAESVTWSILSRWGRFEFRAQRLETESGSETLAGITLTRLVPLPLRLFEALGGLTIAPRQSEVALQLALGKTQDRIADELGLTRATVIYHRRQIYNRLGVDSREQLLERLLHPSRQDLAMKLAPLSRGAGEGPVRSSKLV